MDPVQTFSRARFKPAGDFRKYVTRFSLASLLFLYPLIGSTPAQAEGSFQMGLEQTLLDIPVGTTARYIKVDILNANEVININACGGADANDIQFTVFDDSFLQLNQQTVTDGTVTCTSAMNTNLTGSYQYTAASPGTYYISIDDVNGGTLRRYDVTVTSNAAINPDPTGATGITGRVSAQRWQFNTGAYSEATSTDADYFILTPGGFPSTNYVWQLDLNNFAGFAYDLQANNRGVDAPNSGFSTPRAGNSVSPLFPMYINYPDVAGPTPAQGAAVSGFTFVDDAGNDNSISPGGTVGVQDSGFFEFTTNAIDATYAIYIDVSQDGIYGNAGDVQLNGDALTGFNSIPFDGTDNNGNPLATGSYNAQLGVRLGEFHFIANDAETSGGGASATGSGDGLTVWQATTGGQVSTQVYWDDITVLGAGAGGTSNVPGGDLSGTPGGTHTWGNFTSGGFGNDRYIDTYVYGNTTYATQEVAVVDDDAFTTASVDITDTSVPGDTLTITVTDGDQNVDDAVVDTVSVSVVNDITGEIETLILTETGPDTGIFTSTVGTIFGTAAGANNDGTFNTQNTDTVTVTYNDVNDVFGNPQTLTDTDIVSGGADGTVTITPTSEPGDTLAITVSDADLAGDGTLSVDVTNPVTGETETIVLTESGVTPGLFEGSIDTAFGIAPGAAADGSLNTQNGDTVVVTYNDVFTEAGGTASPTATDTVSGGTTATVTITPTSLPGDTLNVSVNDADQIGAGTLTVTLTNPVTGETESLTLTESSTTPGLFESTIATTFGTTAGVNDDGTFNTQDGDSVIVTYNDVLTASGSPAALTDTDIVGGGITGVVTIDPTSSPGDTVSISVNDTDLSGDGTLVVAVLNPVTGETENVTLTESATTPGLFEGTVATTFGTAAGTNNDGTFNTQNADTLVVTYEDALTTSGGTASPEDTNTVSGANDGVVTITPNSLPGDTLSISVTDADLSGDGSLIVSVTNPATGETETVTLTESTTTPGLFEGTVATAYGTVAGTDNDGTFNTQNADTVVVTYNDAATSSGGTAALTATDVVGGGIDGTVTITPNSTPGDVLAISVTDADLVGDGTLVVTAINPVTGESESVTLTESTTTPGLFEGSVATTYGTAAGTDDDGTFNTQSGETIVVTYNDLLTTTGGTAAPTATDVVGGGIDGVVSITPNIIPGDMAAISVNDADLIGTGTLVVTVVNPDTGESEQVTLTESSATPGLFEANVATGFGTAAGTDNDGIFNVQDGNSLVVTYDDALTTTGGTASPTDTSVVSGGETSTLTITPASMPGDVLTVTVTDNDLDTDPAAVDTVTVTVENTDTGETEQVVLTETGPNTGIFEGPVGTTFGTVAGTNDDGTFNTQNGDTVTATYVDALTDTGGTATLTADDIVSGGVDGVVTITPTSAPGDTLTISVSDADLDTDGTSIETITVTAVNPDTGESETITLTETSANSGVFTGTVDTVFGSAAGTDDDGTFNTETGASIIVTYQDDLTEAGGTAAPTATDVVGGGVDGVVSITPESVPGSDLTINVADADLNTDPTGVETTIVTVVNTVTGETETVTLTETGPNTGIFEADIATTPGSAAGTDNDGTFVSSPADVITVTYEDALTSSGGVNTLTASDNVLGLIIEKTGTLNDGGDGVANVGDTVTYAFSVTNPSGVALSNITLTDVLTPVNGGPLVSLAAGATDSTTFTASYALTQDNLDEGHVTNTAIGNAAGPNGTPVTAASDDPSNTADVDPDGDGNPSDPTVTSIGASPSLALTKSGTVNLGSDGALNEGDVINYVFTVTNTGNVSLTNVSITDPLVSVSGGPLATLAVGAVDTATFTASYVITQTDLNAGSVKNIATVSGTAPGGDPVTGVSDDPANTDDVDTDGDGNPSDPTITPLATTPSIALTKSGSVDLGPDGLLNAGDVINYIFTVTNTGNVLLSDLSISDPMVSVSGGPLSSLAVNATDSATFTADYSITQADLDAGGVTNTATVKGHTPGGDPVTGVSDDPTDTNNIDPDGDGNPSDPTITGLNPNGSMSVLKTATLNDGGDGFADVGDTVTYAFSVKNVGNVTLSNITISDSLAPVSGGPLLSLAPGAIDSGTFSAVYTLTATDLATGSVTNTATANGQTPDGTPVAAVSDDPANVADVDPDGDGNPSDPTVTTLDSNFPPNAEDDSTSTQIGTAVAIPVFANDTDPENDDIIITGVTQGTDGQVSFQPDGTVVYTPNPGFVGIDTFTYTICDERNQCDTAEVTVTIDDDTPSAVADAAGTEPDTPVTLSILTNDTDPNGDILTVTQTTQPDNGNVVINPDGTVTYTPDPGFTGVDTFVYTICDELDYCDTATVTVTVSPDLPQANDDVTTTDSGTPVVMNVIANDSDPNGDPISVTAVTQPANGSVVINPDGTVTYTPDDGYVGIDIFTYTICDDNGNCDTATATVTINNQLPTANDDTASTGEAEPVIISVVDNDSDAEGELTVTAYSPPPTGTVEINPDGTLTYTPEEGFFGDVTFTYTVCDTENACVDANVTVTVTPEFPVLTDDSDTAEPGDPEIIDVLGNDSDPNGDPLTVTAVTQPVGAIVVINDDGTLTVTPDEDFEGELVFTYTACDPDGNCQTANVTVDVEAVSPEAVNDVATTPSATPVTLDPRVNDTDPNGGDLTVTNVVSPEGGTAVINSDGLVVITPDVDFVGDLVVEYEICDTDGNCDTATITVTVDPPVANINGVVFLDINGDDSRQFVEPLESGWLVEVVDTDGNVVASAVTDNNGFYEINDIPVGNSNVRFRNPETQVLFGTIEDVVLNAGLTTIDQNLPIDPSGVFYDAQTRLPVQNVNVTLLGEDGLPLPEVCFVDALQQNQTTDSDGRYRFDIVPGADAACPPAETTYRIDFDAPATHNDGASTVIAGIAAPLNPPAGVGPFQIVPQAMAPAVGEDTRYYLSFILGQGDRDVINNHIPLDPVSIMRAPLQATKSTPKSNISFGDIVPYTLTFTNTEATPRFNLDLVDIAPPGFKYVAGSARINGAAATPVVTGRNIVFGDRTLAGNQTVTIELVLVAGASVSEGRYINQALVQNSLDNRPLSPIAEATVQIVPSPIFDCSEVIGKVYDDKNQNGYQDQGEPGLAGVRVVTAKGLIITTDEHGRYHITCAAVPNGSIGSNFILKLDERSLPTGYRMTSENPRVVRLTRGKMTKLNFGSSIMRVVTLDLAGDAFAGNSMRLNAAMQPHISQLIQVLRSNESVLRLNYHDYENYGGLAQRRLDRVAKHIEHMWKTEGCCYKLTIEQKVMSLEARPTSYNRTGVNR